MTHTKTQLEGIPQWMRAARQSLLRAGGSIPARHQGSYSRHCTPSRLLLLTTLFSLSIAWLGKQGCAQQTLVHGQLQLLTSGNRQYAAMCYTDVTVFFDQLHGFDTRFPFSPDTPVNPVVAAVSPLIKIVLYLLIQWSKILYPVGQYFHLPTGIPVVFFFGVTCVMLSMLWVCIVFMVRKLLTFTALTEHGATIYTYLLACSPLVMVQAFTSLEIVPLFLGIYSLYLLAHHKNTASAVVLGIGITASLWCAVILLGQTMMLLAQHIRNRKKSIASPDNTPPIAQNILSSRNILLTGVIAVAILAFLDICNVDMLTSNYRLLWSSHEDMDSLYVGLESLFNYTYFDEGTSRMGINLTVLVLVFMLIGWVYAVVTSAPSATIYQTIFLLISVLLIVGKTFKPQYSLWLLPLAVLAVPHSKLIVVWMSLDAATWFIRSGTLLGLTDSLGIPMQTFGFFALLRIATLAVVAMYTVLSMLELRCTRSGWKITFIRSAANFIPTQPVYA